MVHGRLDWVEAGHFLSCGLQGDAPGRLCLSRVLELGVVNGSPGREGGGSNLMADPPPLVSVDFAGQCRADGEARAGGYVMVGHGCGELPTRGGINRPGLPPGGVYGDGVDDVV